MGIEGERVLVTGAARRLGLAAAQTCAEAGADVALHYFSSEAEAKAEAKRISERGVKAKACYADLSKEGEASRLLRMLEAEDFLPSIIVNSSSRYAADTFDTVDRDTMKRELDLTAYAPFEMARSFSRLVERGTIINVLDARMVDYDTQHLSYHLAKRSLLDITRILAVELAPRIRVNGIAPGIILPPEESSEEHIEKFRRGNLLERVGSVEDFTEALMFLAKASFVTGDVLFIDGGRHLRGRMYGV